MKLLLKLLIFISLFIPTFTFADTPNFPDFPMSFWGTATLNNSALPSGTIIQAYCSDNLVGQVTTKEIGIYGYSDSAKQKLLVSGCSGTIVFKTGDAQIQYVDGFGAGETKNFNLNFTTSSNGGGSSSSGGGGGGGGGVSPSSTPNIQTTGDINNDGKINILDFSVIMSEWGQVGTTLSSDMNRDGKIDIFDFSILMANWN